MKKMQSHLQELLEKLENRRKSNPARSKIKQFYRTETYTS